MADLRLPFSRDSFSGTWQDAVVDDRTGAVKGFWEYEDPDRTLEAAKLFADFPPGRTMRHIACVPPHIFNKSLREKWTPGDWRKWLDDPDYSRCRTHPR